VNLNVCLCEKNGHTAAAKARSGKWSGRKKNYVPVVFIKMPVFSGSLSLMRGKYKGV